MSCIRPTRVCGILPAVATVLLSLLPSAASLEAAPPKPNFIVVFVDNSGNGDLGCFGSKLHRTPNVDRLAAEERKFTSFYVSAGVCTPSRASLITGCYPRRVNMHVSDTNSAVLRPVSPKGLHPKEVTIARAQARSKRSGAVRRPQRRRGDPRSLRGASRGGQTPARACRSRSRRARRYGPSGQRPASGGMGGRPQAAGAVSEY